MFKINIPKKAEIIMDHLESRGFSSYIVGGSVRDSIMGETPSDWDICTSARPEQVEDALMDCQAVNKIIETGIKHGTVTAVSGTSTFEITTFRVDGSYSDGRHPDSVEFRTDVRDDLSRRDFTINAMAYSEKEGLIDPFGGRDDIEKKVIRCVGEPEKRFEEDALRIMRALRFASKLGFEIETETAAAVRKMSPSVRNVADERVAAELCGLISGRDAAAVTRHYHRDIYKATGLRIAPKNRLYALDRAPDDITVRLNIFFPYDTEKALKRLKFSNQIIRETLAVKKLAQDTPPVTKRDTKYFLKKAAALVGKVRAGSTAKRALSMREALYGENHMRQMGMISEVSYNECYTLDGLSVKGEDLIKAGVKPGKQIGAMLEAMLTLVMDGRVPNEKRALMDFLYENDMIR
jgi:tRNA nucleotidyltransferase (CCA-adding enzyme)